MTDSEAAENGQARQTRRFRKRRAVIALLLVVGACSAFFGVWEKEQCPYAAVQPSDGYTVRLCYKKAVPWLPLLFPEGYYVYADLYDSSGHRVQRRRVDTVDVAEDVHDRFSRIRWTPSLRAFVDNRGDVVTEPPAR